MNPAEKASIIDRRHFEFLVFFVLSIAIFWTPLRAAASLSWNDDRYSHLLIIPVISGFLLYLERGKIFSQPKDRGRASLWLLLGISIVYAISFTKLGADWHLTLAILSATLAWSAIFAFCYGSNALLAAAFPFGFLAFMIPLPENVLNWMVHELQSASADVSSVLFHVIGMPSFRQGFRFMLPGLQIEVASECSGIRSTMALLLVSVLAGYVLLRTPSRRICFALLAIPIGIFKNAVRIVTLSYLGVYVDRAYLEGRLHHQYGGLVFSSLALFLVVPLLILLRKSEAHPKGGVNDARPVSEIA
jgi:exosortase